MRGETPFGASPVAGRGALALPPSSFLPAPTQTIARRAKRPPFANSSGRTAAQKAGIRYQKKVEDYLRNMFPKQVTIGPWFEFMDQEGRLRFCQPDALLLAGDTCVIFEIKIRHMARAWWQLRQLYHPVVRAALAPKHIGLVEICRAFDPMEVVPEKIDLLDDIQTSPLDCIEWGAKVKAFVLRL